VTEKLVTVCSENGVFIYTGLHRRSDPHYLNLGTKIKRGDLGTCGEWRGRDEGGMREG
jgi:predicted dehydrogenase